MNKREQRVINAFINCVKRGEFTFDYACLLIEDSAKYGYLSDTVKEGFYSAFDGESDGGEDYLANDEIIN